MKFKKVNENLYILRLELGEEVISEVISFCKDLDIESAEINGLGALKNITLKHYSINNKNYSEKYFEEEMEISSLYGFMTSAGLHAHIVVSNNKMHSFGGHLESGIVSATCEIILKRIPIKLNRKHDNTTGLKILDI